MGNTLAAIDVGSSKICTLVAETTPESDLRILGVGVTPAHGVKKGMVDNIQQATEAITTSVERAEKSSGSRVVSAHVSIGGKDVRAGRRLYGLVGADLAYAFDLAAVGQPLQPHISAQLKRVTAG